jgi:hypothetical protein
MSDEKGFTDQVLNSFKERFTSPYLAFFTTAWIFHNWKLITAILTLDHPFYERIGHLQQFFNTWDLLIHPVWKAGVIFLIYMLLSLIAHYLYSLFKKTVSWIDRHVSKSDQHLKDLSNTYQTAFYAVKNNGMIRVLIDKYPNEVTAKKIAVWVNCYNSDISSNETKKVIEKLEGIAIKNLAAKTGLEIMSVLEELKVVRYWRGAHIFTMKGLYYYCNQNPDIAPLSILETTNEVVNELKKEESSKSDPLIDLE